MKIFFALALSLIFVACGGKHQAINPDWKNTPEFFSVLVSEPYVLNLDDVTDDFGTVDVFRNWLTSYLDTSFSSYTNVRRSVKMVPDESFEVIGVALNDEVLKIPMPLVEKIEGLNGIVVSMHPLRFWREKSSCSRGGCIGDKHLYFVVAYSIVRVEDRQILAYGITHGGDSFTFAMTKGNWESVLDKVVMNIIEKTPLKK